jgi:hypothetical protein
MFGDGDILITDPPTTLTLYSRFRDCLGWSETFDVLELTINYAYPYTYYSAAYPNPASSVLHIEMEDASQTTLQSATDVYRIQLVHAQTGAVALNQTVGSLSGNLELNVSTVPDGLYSLVLTRNSTVVHAQAVLIQH